MLEKWQVEHLSEIAKLFTNLDKLFESAKKNARFFGRGPYYSLYKELYRRIVMRFGEFEMDLGRIKLTVKDGRIVISYQYKKGKWLDLDLANPYTLVHLTNDTGWPDGWVRGTISEIMYKFEEARELGQPFPVSVLSYEGGPVNVDKAEEVCKQVFREYEISDKYIVGKAEEILWYILKIMDEKFYKRVIHKYISG